VQNEGHGPVTAYVRPTTIAAKVEGPSGAVECPVHSIAPARDLFTTLGSKGRASATILVDALCPQGALDHAGIYKVTPALDTRGASGGPYRMRTADDVFWAAQPTELRVRVGKKPPKRVALDPAPSGS
jgi:hypothetical protein